jgi:hypothetical protein
MSDKLTKDGKTVRAGDIVYLSFARHENTLNVVFSLTASQVVEAHGELVVVTSEFGSWVVTPHVGNWFSTPEAAKLHALTEAELTFAKFRAAVAEAEPQ